MASLFSRSDSPYWFLRIKTDKGWEKRNTKLRRDDPRENAAAHALRAEWEAAEHRLKGRSAASVEWDWVEPWLLDRTCQPTTLKRYVDVWRRVRVWLDSIRARPSDIRYKHAHEYIAWRTGKVRESGKSTGRNTALLELKVVSMILDEAVRREFIHGNVWAKLAMKRTPPKLKPAVTEEERQTIERLLQGEPEWMLTAWKISLATGCRLRETRIPLSCIDLESAPPTITWPSPKGGASKSFSAPVPTSLMEMFGEMIRDGREYTLEIPFQPSRKWQAFFQRAGLPHLTFHCLRVTKVTLLHAARRAA